MHGAFCAVHIFKCTFEEENGKTWHSGYGNQYKKKEGKKLSMVTAAQLRPVTGDRGERKKHLIRYCTERKEKQRESLDRQATHKLLYGQS